MGIERKYATFPDALAALNLGHHVHGVYPSVLVIENKRVAFNLIGLATADELTVRNLQQYFREQNIQLINLWEDVWKHRQQQVISRLLSLAGLNKRIFARNCAIVAITQHVADRFLESNHLQGTAKTKFRYALKKDDAILAVAAFNVRPMPSKGNNYYSAELVRFCSRSGVTIVGGLSKLISYFAGLKKPADIMTYADRDWSDGSGYIKLGFNLIEITPFIEMWLTAEGKRLTVNKISKLPEGSGSDLIPVFNSGNLKFIKRYGN